MISVRDCLTMCPKAVHAQTERFSYHCSMHLATGTVQRSDVYQLVLCHHCLTAEGGIPQICMHDLTARSATAACLHACLKPVMQTLHKACRKLQVCCAVSTQSSDCIQTAAVSGAIIRRLLCFAWMSKVPPDIPSLFQSIAYQWVE